MRGGGRGRGTSVNAVSTVDGITSPSHGYKKERERGSSEREREREVG